MGGRGGGGTLGWGINAAGMFGLSTRLFRNVRCCGDARARLAAGTGGAAGKRGPDKSGRERRRGRGEEADRERSWRGRGGGRDKEGNRTSRSGRGAAAKGGGWRRDFSSIMRLRNSCRN